MGKNARRRREQRVAQRQQLAAVGAALASLSGSERLAVELIAWGQDPRNPPCPGPVIVHRDGTFECHGGCEGVMEAFHDDDALDPCPGRAEHLRYHCSRCQRHPYLDSDLIWN